MRWASPQIPTLQCENFLPYFQRFWNFFKNVPDNRNGAKPVRYSNITYCNSGCGLFCNNRNPKLYKIMVWNEKKILIQKEWPNFFAVERLLFSFRKAIIFLALFLCDLYSQILWTLFSLLNQVRFQNFKIIQNNLPQNNPTSL